MSSHDIKRPFEALRSKSTTFAFSLLQGESVSLGQLSQMQVTDGAYDIYRENNQRYLGVRYSVRGRDLGSAVGQAIREVNSKVQLPKGYHIEWAGE